MSAKPVSFDAALQDQLVGDRDAKLIEWFSEGHANEEVVRLCQEHHLDLSLRGVKDAKARLEGRVASMLASQGAEFLARVPRAHRSVRLHAANELYNRLEAASRKCTGDAKKFPTLVKLAEVQLKALRYMAEESRDIAPATQGLEKLAELVRNASPEQRRAFVVRAQELRTVLEIGIETGGDGQARLVLPMLEAHIEADDAEE